MSKKDHRLILIKNEEFLNVATHGLGFLMSIVGGIYLFQLALTAPFEWGMMAATVFILSMCVLYFASTVYHWYSWQKGKDHFRLKMFDHIAIYFLIAGTYTPFTLLLLEGLSARIIFSAVWGLAILGTLFKLKFGDAYPWISLVLYLLMGWLIIIDIGQLIELGTLFTLSFLLAGGISYTLGTIFYVNKSWKYHHPVWHLFVIGGTTSHFVSICSLYF
ncbi:MAG: hemolysin III family protein [Bacteroidetes bacterium]|nr:hemolysin III family protein [Bacteroidota bacterium]